MDATDVEIARKIMDYLETTDPDIAEAVRKTASAGFNVFASDKLADALRKGSPGVGDTHATTALGNQPGSKKLSFAEIMETRKNGKNVKVVKPPSDEPTVDKAEWSFPITVVKADADKQQIFGWASICTKDGAVVVDKQGDIIMPDDLEAAVYDFVLYCRSQGDMHKTDDDGKPLQVGRVIESVMLTKEKQKAMAKSFDGLCELRVEGWWIGMQVDHPETWAAIKRGERPEFSIGGRERESPLLNGQPKQPSLEDQLEELKGVLGQRQLGDFIVFDMSQTEEAILGALMARQWVSRESLITILYAAKPDADRPDDKSLDVFMSHVRVKLRKKKIKLSLRYGEGWYLKPEQKEKVKTVIAEFKRSEALAVEAVMLADKTFAIEKDVPIPHDLRASKYPFMLMLVGDSFFIKDRKKSVAYSAIRGFRTAHKTNPEVAFKFKVRVELGGVRVWRIK